LKKNIINNINEQQKLTIELQNNIKDLINYSEKFKERDFFTPFEIKITSNCPYIGKSLSEIRFWQNTGATVLGIRRKDSIIVSPGPHAIFLENDIFVMVGDEETNLRVRNYLQ